MSQPLYTRDADGLLVASAHARGPWDPRAQHGGAPAALLADAVQALAPEMQVARLTYELLGPVPLAPLRLEVAVVRPGRRFQLAEGRLVHEGRPVVLVRAVLLRRQAVEVPAQAGWAADGPPLDGPGQSRSMAFGVAQDGEAFHLTGMELRFEGPGSWSPGPARVWFRLGRPLVDLRPPPPVARAAAAADFGNGVSRVLDFEAHLFINTDLTVQLVRDPVGEWVLLDARTGIGPDGVGQAFSTLHDERGPFGHAHQSLLVATR